LPARHNAVGLGRTFGFLDCSNTELRQVVVKEIGEVIRRDNEYQFRAANLISSKRLPPELLIPSPIFAGVPTAGDSEGYYIPTGCA